MKIFENEKEFFVATKDDALIEEFSVIEGEDAISNARQYANFIPGDNCGPWHVKYVKLRNSHGSRRIGVTVRTRWYYNGQPRTSTRNYHLNPGQIVGIGCPIPGPTAQRFDFTIDGAWYL